MKTVSQTLIGTCLSLGILFPCPGIAQETGVTSPWSLSATGGALLYEGDEAVDDTWLLGLLLGYAWSDRITLEAGAFFAPDLDGNTRFDVASGRRVSRLEQSAGVTGTEAYGLSLETLFHIGSRERLDPSLALGVGLVDYADEFDSSPEVMLRAGAGLTYHINDAFGLRADGRVLVAGEDSEINGILTAGVTWTPAPGLFRTAGDDMDGDGLSDMEEVQEHGTDPNNRDSDFDGLSDGDEVMEWRTNPLERDTDGGGVYDGHEVYNDKTDPLKKDDDLRFFDLKLVFDDGGDAVSAEYLSELDIVGRTLKQEDGARARIEAHVPGNTNGEPGASR